MRSVRFSKVRTGLIAVLCVLYSVHLLFIVAPPDSRRKVDSPNRRRASVCGGEGSGEPAAKSTARSGAKRTNTTPSLVLIMARARSGSTYIGQFFNQHPEVFYFFEPLRVIPEMVSARLIRESGKTSMQEEILASLYRCSFPTFYLSHAEKWPLAVFESKAMTSAGEKISKMGEGHVNPWRYTELCRAHRALAAKVIRLERIDALETLVTHYGLDVKVIFLTRDPRAYASSWKRFAFYQERELIKGKTLFDLRLLSTNVTGYTHPPAINAFCDWLKYNLKVIARPPDWLRGRVKVVRYEDAAREPYTFLEDLYEFLDMSPHADIYHWLRANTNAETNSSLAGTMVTRRNSSYVVQAWRDDMLFYDVKAIQNVCGQLMNALGYAKLNRPKEMADWSIPVLSKPVIH